MSDTLPESLQPTREDIARDQELAAEAKAIVAEGGGRVRVNTESYNSVTFGPDGKPVSRTRNGVAQQSPEEEAVARSQAAANSDIMNLERDLQRLIDRHDEISGYDSEGNPIYVLHELDRQQVAKNIRRLRLGLVNQKRLNERRWRKDAAPAVRRLQEDRIKADELSKELEARGRVQRVPSW